MFVPFFILTMVFEIVFGTISILGKSKNSLKKSTFKIFANGIAFEYLFTQIEDGYGRKKNPSIHAIVNEHFWIQRCQYAAH